MPAIMLIADSMSVQLRSGIFCEAAVRVNGDDNGDHQAHIALGALVEILGELTDVDAVLAEGRADGGRRSRFSGGDLESDVSNYFLCQVKAPLSCYSLMTSTWSSSRSTGVSRPNMETTTRTRSFSGSSSSTTP